MYDYGQVRAPIVTARRKPLLLRKGVVLLGLVFVGLLLVKKPSADDKPLSPIQTAREATPRAIVAREAPSPLAAATLAPTAQTSVSTSELITEIDNLVLGKQGQYGWYVQSLAAKTGYGSNFDFSYTAASINKIPIMMAFLQRIEDGTYSLDDTYALEDQDIEGGSGTLQYQKLGSRWSYKQLVQFAGHYSDNTAINAMHRLAGPGSAQRVVDGLRLPKTSINKNTSSPKDMVALLAQIFSGDVVQDKNLLALFYKALQDTEYEQDLIPEGVPGNVPVSHKIGWQVQVWSDCAIVFGQKPYALCVMTDGIAEQEARELVPQISRKVWLFESGDYNSSR